METNGGEWRERFIVERAHFPHLLSSLRARGYQAVRDQAIVYDTLNSVEDLPIRYTDEQDGGSYRLGKREDAAVFGYAVGPHSWKQFLHPPALRLWSARRDGNRVQLVPEEDHPPRSSRSSGSTPANSRLSPFKIAFFSTPLSAIQCIRRGA